MRRPTATDSVTRTPGNVSAQRARVLAVLAAIASGVIGSLPSTAAAASEACTSPSGVVLDGYVGSTYAKLRAQPNPTDPNTTWVCFRARGGGVDQGGRIDVTGPGLSPQPPTVDPNYEACSTTPGNTVPGPHPLLSGQVGDPSEPPFVPFLVDIYSASGAAWACLQAGSVQQRVIVNTGGVSPPAVAFLADAPGPAPTPTPGPLGQPSSTCQNASQGTKRQLVNADVGGTQVWAYESEPSPTRIDVCARVQGARTAGGMLSVDTTGVPGIKPTLELSPDTSPCTVTVASVTDPVQASVTRSPSGANPASLCVAVADTPQRVTVGATGEPMTPTVTWTPDSDSAV